MYGKSQTCQRGESENVEDGDQGEWGQGRTHAGQHSWCEQRRAAVRLEEGLERSVHKVLKHHHMGCFLKGTRARKGRDEEGVGFMSVCHLNEGQGIGAHLSDNADEADNIGVGDFLHVLNFLEKGQPEGARGLCGQLLDHDRVKLVPVGVCDELALVYANALSRGGMEGRGG